MQRSRQHRIGMRPPLAVGWWWLLLAFLGLGTSLRAQESPGQLEGRVKAAFLVKFALFIEWPANADNTRTNEAFVIGVYGNEPFAKLLAESTKFNHVQGLPVVVRHSNKPEKLAGCRMVFVAGNETHPLENILRQFEGRPVLTVTDAPGGALRGSMINFVKANGKVRFEFNVAAAERAQLKFSAKLLQAGKIVVPGQTETRGDE